MHSAESAAGDRVMAGLPKPTTVEQCHSVIDALAVQLAALRDQVAWLQERVAPNHRSTGHFAAVQVWASKA